MPTSDVERFFRQIVRNLAVSDPARLHRPMPLSDIRESIVPYRANRRALQLESSEDYELVLLRLCAGEGGFARTEPEEARAEFVAQIESSNPDLTISYRHEKAMVSLEPKLVAQALKPKSDLAFAPPSSPLPPPAEVSPPAPDLSLEPYETVPESEPAPAGSRCDHCGGNLPVGRTVKFCPHCGANQSPPRCPECKAELEPGWRHCIICGLPVAQP
jgi:hypothetical protein